MAVRSRSHIENKRVWDECGGNQVSVDGKFECVACKCECVQVKCAVLGVTVPYLGNPQARMNIAPSKLPRLYRLPLEIPNLKISLQGPSKIKLKLSHKLDGTNSLSHLAKMYLKMLKNKYNFSAECQPQCLIVFFVVLFCQ